MICVENYKLLVYSNKAWGLLGASRDLLPIFGNLKLSLTALIYSGLTVDASEPAPRVDIRHCHHSGQHVSLHFPAEKHGQEDQR